MRLIDADAFVESIKGVEVIWYLDGNYETYDDTTIMDIIEEQPTVEAVPVVRGEWIHVPSSDMATGKAYECSNCKKCDMVRLCHHSVKCVEQICELLQSKCGVERL